MTTLADFTGPAHCIQPHHYTPAMRGINAYLHHPRWDIILNTPTHHPLKQTRWSVF